jgi:phosphoenolpyruvate carboxykinase (GTP)
MLPFCGYNMADYFAHWLRIGAGRADKLPKIFHVNWFRTDADGKFIWPGFGENVRVLRWIRERCLDQAEARETPIGYVPTRDSLDLRGIENKVSAETLDALLRVAKEDWAPELEDQQAFFEKFGERIPSEIWKQHAALSARLGL